MARKRRLDRARCRYAWRLQAANVSAMLARINDIWASNREQWTEASWAQRGAQAALFMVYAVGLALLAQRAYWFALHAWVRVRPEAAIQWLEPLHMRNALQAMQGEPLYGQPGADFVGGMYTPGTDLLHGWALTIFGVGYPTLRVVAVIGLFFMLLVAGRWVYRESKSWAWAAMAVGALLSLRLHVEWFTTVNVDAPYLLASLAAFYVLMYHSEQRRMVIAAAVLLALSFLFKPQGFVLAVAATAYLIAHHRSQVWVFAAVCAGLAGGAVAYLVLSSNGWFWTMVVDVPFGIATKGAPRVWANHWQLSAPASIATMLSAAGVLVALGRAQSRVRASLLLAFLLATLLVAWASFRKVGGAGNSVHPTLFAGILLFALLPDLLLRRGTLTHSWVRFGQVGAVILLLVTGFKGSRSVAERLTAAPTMTVAANKPMANYMRFDKKLQGIVEELGDDVFVGARPLVQHGLGLKLNAHQTPIYNLTVRTKEQSYTDIFAEHSYDALVLWRYGDNGLQKYISKTHEAATTVGRDPLTGGVVEVWRRVRPAPPGPELALHRQTRETVAREGAPYEVVVSRDLREILVGVAFEGDGALRSNIAFAAVQDNKVVHLKTIEVSGRSGERWRDVALGMTVASGTRLRMTAGKGVVISRPALIRADAPAASMAGERRPSPRAKNVIVVSIDTLRADYLGAYGYEEHPTSPQLDAWAGQGALFEHVTAPSPWTVPSHAAMFTGAAPDSMGLDKKVYRTPRVARSQTMLAELFRDAGYLTVAFTGTATIGARNGFSDGFYLYQEATTPPLGSNVLLGDLSTNMKAARGWLENNIETPLFMFFHTYEVHSPYRHTRFVAADSKGTQKDRERYASGIAYTDEKLIPWLRNLESLGLLDDTLVVITSDHGESFLEHPHQRGHGRSLYEEALRVPLIMRGPGVPKGMRISESVPLIDLFATLIDIQGLAPPTDSRSTSLLPLLRGETREREPFYLCCMAHHGQRQGMRNGPNKYIRTKGGEELFNLDDDPAEQRNLAAAGGTVLETMRADTIRQQAEHHALAKGATHDAVRTDPDYEEQLRALGYIR